MAKVNRVQHSVSYRYSSGRVFRFEAVVENDTKQLVDNLS